MTTLGKILVFLVFVAALAMGGLMVYVSKTTPNWKVLVDDQKKAMEVYNAQVQQDTDSRKELLRQIDQQKKLLDSLAIEKQNVIEKYKAESRDLAEQAAKSKLQQEKSDLLHTQAQAQTKRLQDENEYMRAVLAEREKTIAAQLHDLETARATIVSVTNDADQAQKRAQTLYEQLKEAQRVALQKEQQSQSPRSTVAAVRDSTYTNPPSVYVKGKVERVDSEDKTLVKISIGTDQGLRKDNTLEVFRFQPKAQYLGRLLVVDAEPHSAICRLLRAPGTQSTEVLVAGDEVASKLRQ
jgi:hypothetical protein